MTEAAVEPRPSDTITVILGVEACGIFLAIIWQRQGYTSEEIASILGASKWDDGSPGDLA